MSTWPAIIEIARKCRKKVTGKAAGRRGGGREETRTQCEGREPTQGRRCDGKKEEDNNDAYYRAERSEGFYSNFPQPKKAKEKQALVDDKSVLWMKIFPQPPK
jgi:hypothetical protein